MTGNAAPGEQALVGTHAAPQRLRSEQIVRMPGMRVALLAQERNRGDEQAVVIGAVRIVTVDATVAYGCMFEQKRSALGSVALIAGFVDRVGLE